MKLSCYTSRSSSLQSAVEWSADRSY